MFEVTCDVKPFENYASLLDFLILFYSALGKLHSSYVKCAK